MSEFREFFVFDMPFPICNHNKYISTENIGYVQGMLYEGLPFEAELWKDGKEINLTFVIPYIELEEENRVKNNQNSVSQKHSNIVGFRREEQCRSQGILTIGMVENGIENNFEVIKFYIELLEGSGVLNFTSNYQNGSVLYMIDILGNDLTVIHILIEDGDKIIATTPIEFEPFNPFKK